MSTMYGQLPSEKLAEENNIARQIVKEIANFGINDRQRTLVIYLLAMELENVQLLQELTFLIKEHSGDSLFLSERKQ